MARILLTKRVRRQNVKKSRVHERAAATRFGGRVQPGSGSQWHSKGDVKSDRFLISCKRTDKESYRLTQKDWHTAVEDGFQENRHPAMALEIAGLNLYVIDENMFALLQHVVREVENG